MPPAPAAASQAPPGRRRAASTITVKFMPVETGIRDGEQIEMTSGLDDGARVITTGAGALQGRRPRRRRLDQPDGRRGARPRGGRGRRKEEHR